MTGDLGESSRAGSRSATVLAGAGQLGEARAAGVRDRRAARDPRRRVAALHEGRRATADLDRRAVGDRDPEFVWAVLLLIVFALGLGLFPTTAQFPEGADLLTQLKYLLLPAMCLVFVLFGYIARMARAGTIEALDADYTRTAVIKGLPSAR